VASRRITSRTLSKPRTCCKTFAGGAASRDIRHLRASIQPSG
jgi:hypothetical protein